jgi:hypothetical protein
LKFADLSSDRADGWPLLRRSLAWPDQRASAKLLRCEISGAVIDASAILQAARKSSSWPPFQEFCNALTASQRAAFADISLAGLT